MGNSDLRELAAIEQEEFSYISGSTLAIDAHNWLYKYLTTTTRWTDTDVYTTQDGESVPNIIGVIQGLPPLLEQKTTPVFVFDGRPPDLKSDELERRREGKRKAEEKREEALEEGDNIRASKLESRSQRLNDLILDTTKELFRVLDVPIIQAPREAEAQCAHMTREDDDVDYAASDDYDTLVYGCPFTVRDFTGGDEIELMDYLNTLDKHDINREQLVDIAILCGTDYNDGVSGFGPVTSLDAIRKHGDIWTVIEEDDDISIDNLEQVRELLLQPEVLDPDEYNYDSSITPDIDAARSYAVDEWEIPEDEISRGLTRIEDATSQSGLDRWT